MGWSGGEAKLDATTDEDASGGGTGCIATLRADIEPDGPTVSPLDSSLPLVFVLSDDVGASRKAFGGVESDLPSTMLKTAKRAVSLDFAGIMGFSLS